MSPTSRNRARMTLTRARRLAMRQTWFLRPLPDVVVLGAMKSGSTSVYELMLEHPAVRGAVRKEVHFLDIHYDRGLRWWRGQFPPRWPGQDWTAVEATPMYLSFPPAPQRLRAVGVQPRFVVLLRDPVERAVSHWRHRNREGRDSRSLEQVIADEAGMTDDDAVALAAKGIAAYQPLVLAHGHYAAQLVRWQAAFPVESFLVIEAQSFFTDPQTTMDRVFDFAGLGSVPIADARARNAGDAREVSKEALAALADYYAPLNDDLFALLGRRFPWM